MPRSISTQKRIRQNERRRIRNRTIKTHIRTARRAFLDAIAEGKLDEARSRFHACERLLYRAAVNGPLHRKTAGRVVGRLRRRLNAVERAAQ